MEINKEILAKLENLDKNEVHNYRYAISIQYILKYFPDVIDVLEIGEITNFTTVLKEYMPNINLIYSTGGDIRKQITITKDKVDLVICMEVIEHLSDIDSDDIGVLATYNGTGVKGFFNALKPYMKETTQLFITTPNINNYKCIFNLMYGAHAFAYGPHHRELCINDITDMLKESNYETTLVTTETVWNNHQLHPYIIHDIHNLIKKYGLSTENRGDDIFIIAKIKN